MAMKNNSKGGLVYSTDAGRMCPGCRLALAQCACQAKAVLAENGKGNGMVRVALQTKGRGGKSVTLVTGLALDCVALASLGNQLRTACGSGGTVKDGVIEVQGEHCALVMQVLEKHGHRAKRAGG